MDQKPERRFLAAVYLVHPSAGAATVDNDVVAALARPIGMLPGSR
ncbi:MAG: hypothetical protein JWR16_716 [Nevskia sp.]|nr:hypothetical protein [Nevskia sp.]